MVSTSTDNPAPNNQAINAPPVQMPIPEEESNTDSKSLETFSAQVSSARRLKRVALVGIYAALILALDYLPGRPPNVEFMTCLLFIAGYCFGARIGGLTALVVSATFSYLNPLGPSQPSLFAFQVGFYVGVALLGNLFSRARQRRPFILGARGSLVCGALGVLCTLAFDVGSTFAFGLPLTNWNWVAVWPIWFSGIVFTVVHLVSNAIIFAFLLPVVTNAILTQFGDVFAKSSQPVAKKGVATKENVTPE